MKLSRRVLELSESATLAVSAQAARLKAEGVDVISFGAGEPDFDTPDHIKEAAIDAIRAGDTKYAKPASGTRQAKQAVCTKFHRDNQLSYTPDQVIVTAGGKMAVYLMLHAVLNPGDEAIIPVPYWVSYPEIVRLAGGVPVMVRGPEAVDYKLTPDILKGAITERTRVFIFNSPSNPSGVTYDPDEVRVLAKVLEDRDIWILSDEIYDQLLFGGQKTLSFAATGASAYGRTLTMNALSKPYAMTGWRVGYAAGPLELVAGMIRLQSQSTSGTATFNHRALVEALTGDQSPVQEMRREFERRGRFMHESLLAIPGVRCPKPTGAFYCFPDVSACYSRLGVSGSVEFAERVLNDARVAVVPGVAFGMDQCVRLSFATGMTAIREGLDRLRLLLVGREG